MRTHIAITTTSLLLATSLAFAKGKPAEEEPPVVQIALLLDTSGSMDGLLAQAKTQLWKVVNEFIGAEQKGQAPVVQVALYEYGNNGLSEETHWIRRIQPLTRDLDKVSEELFALKTNGGEEYCGAVIQRAAEDLDWDESQDTFKAIFIAGNEAFTQGPIKAESVCKETIAKGIIVNTIHCGSEADGISGKWKQGAMLADGQFLIIDQNRAVAHIEAPQDKKIAELNESLNGTYITYGGTKGQEAKQNQLVQDSNAAQTQSGAQRIATKASANYWNASWDLVDACKAKDFKLSELKPEQLPEEMKKMTVEEREAHIKKKADERTKIQKDILALNGEREKYVAEKLKESGEDDTVGAAMVKAIRSQAEAKAITFK